MCVCVFYSLFAWFKALKHLDILCGPPFVFLLWSLQIMKGMLTCIFNCINEMDNILGMSIVPNLLISLKERRLTRPK